MLFPWCSIKGKILPVPSCLTSPSSFVIPKLLVYVQIRIKPVLPSKMSIPKLQWAQVADKAGGLWNSDKFRFPRPDRMRSWSKFATPEFATPTYML